MLCCSTCIFVVLLPWAQGNTIKLLNQEDGEYYCMSYESNTDDSYIIFKKCDPEDPTQSDWFWHQFKIPTDSDPGLFSP